MVAARPGERREVYLTDPDELISAFRREREIAHEDEGREILELLQNANDAGAEAGQKSSVRVACYIANKLPFG